MDRQLRLEGGFAFPCHAHADWTADENRPLSARGREDAERVAEELGFPVVIRPAYTMGGTGGGLVYNLEGLRTVTARGKLTTRGMAETHEWIDVDFEFVDLARGHQARPEYLAINPNGMVPALVDGDRSRVNTG